MVPDPRDEADELGPRVAELALLDETPRDGFLLSVRESVLRRVGAVDALDFGVPMLVRFMESVLSMIFGLLGNAEAKGTHTDPKGSGKDRDG